MGLIDLLRRKPVVDPDIERKRFLTEHGRITDGRIIETEPRPNGEVIFYIYTLNGVDFESSEFLTNDRLTDQLRYAPGAKIGVRYDPKNQGNSMLD